MSSRYNFNEEHRKEECSEDEMVGDIVRILDDAREFVDDNSGLILLLVKMIRMLLICRPNQDYHQHYQEWLGEHDSENIQCLLG